MNNLKLIVLENIKELGEKVNSDLKLIRGEKTNYMITVKEDRFSNGEGKVKIEDTVRDKDIYIICNSGAKGAEKATEVLTESGIDPSRLFTVEGGAKALAEVDGALTTNRTEENIEWQYVSGEDAVAAVGDDEVQFLDVRDDETYAAGHLEGSLQCNLKEIEDAEAQTQMYELATGEMDPEKPVYILCYSGNNCAKTAISVMKDAGFDTDNLFIIEDGAKNAEVSAAFVTE